MKYFIGAVSVIVLLIVGYLIFIYSGMYNISAMVHHDKLTLWMMNTVRENSIKNNAEDDIKMPNLSDTSLVSMGFDHYREMCVGCHGGPGIEQSELAQGLYPNPPMLTKVANNWTPQQLFWITKNGLKMTGMPAFGKTHTNDMIWAIVAFTKMLPDMTPEEYQKMESHSDTLEEDDKHSDENEQHKNSHSGEEHHH